MLLSNLLNQIYRIIHFPGEQNIIRQRMGTYQQTTVLVHDILQSRHLCTDLTPSIHGWKLSYIRAVYVSALCRYSKAWLSPASWINNKAWIILLELSYLQWSEKNGLNLRAKAQENKEVRQDMPKPFLRSWGSSDICARGNPWKGTGSRRPAWMASCKPQLTQDSA